MAVRVSDQSSPLLTEPAAIDDGLEHYRSMCVRCHGGPGVKPDEFAEGLTPPAPRLETAGAEFTEGELFWIVKHGIRMTGMPVFGKTHSEDDVWKIVAAVKHLPGLSSDRKRELSADSSGGHHHELGPGNTHAE